MLAVCATGSGSGVSSGFGCSCQGSIFRRLSFFLRATARTWLISVELRHREP